MTPEQQRIAIAEACGWKRAEERYIWSDPVNGEWAYACHLPDYLNDLNAMHEAEKMLHGDAHPSAQTELEEKFRDELAKLMKCAWYQSARLLRATAAQRAEAFLRTLNLWT